MIIIVSIPWFWRYRIELERDKPQPITSLFRSAEMDYSIISFLEVVFDHKASQAHYHFWPLLLVSLLPRGPAKCLWQRWMEWSSGKSSQGKTENRSSAYDEKRKNFPHERTLRLTLIKYGSTFSLFFGTQIFETVALVGSYFNSFLIQWYTYWQHFNSRVCKIYIKRAYGPVFK